ncbi:MAG: hypothetical protein AB1938_15700 [Myxococcota bacterium]
MLPQGHPAYAVVAVLVALILLRLHLWRAVLFLRPQSVLVEVDTPDGGVLVPGALEAAWEGLKALGFTPLGSHLEHARFSAPVTLFDAAHAEKGMFASVFEGKDGQVRVVLLTPTEGGFVLTANYRRPAREVPGRYSSGGLEGASVERLVNAHARRIAAHSQAKAPWTLEARVDAARRWYRGAGKAELRQQHAVGLLWTLGALGMVAAAIASAIGERS